ncbi:urea transport protein [Scheffersomyces stipitis CBS 6054]|uniref:Urea transport protein n=1 Tax=Scheffersomyces stipitis (strain ATCC 58785 / CBS 6054 / NBRC 10063 / NRRL Y-11545) TaxID=322104 RepID=A3GI43_PICST|nr:urea transport protein [Scheffersomyces stipitis CBS 6054]EAZ62922.1 urea transport protein [Scheffersomyces stipitis CBS 6054]
MSSASQSVELLGQGAGYGILVGVGALFAGGMILTTKLLQRYLHENSNSTETFAVANRSVGTFLSASAVYSSWSWATELLWTSTMVYNYGIQASYYYGAGLAVQIAVMSVIGIHAKKKAPSAHTSLEIVELRYGRVGHILYLFLGLANNLLSCASMILGASGAISIIAGNLHPVASTMLIPFGVLLYTVVGGLKATFLTDFVHTLILLLVLCYLNTSVLTSDQIGGLDGLYNALVKKDGERYIEGNFDGSILTGKSKGALFFGLILTAGNFGLTVLDSSFWQKTFSASPRATVPAYLIACFFIFANVWPLGSIIGGASIVLEGTPGWPTYPREMTQYEIDSGFVLPYVLKQVLGNGGVGALLLVIYLAVTSTVSAQMISVSSILSFDIYKKYINPSAQNKQMIRISHISVVFFGLFCAAFSVMLHYVGVNMTWLGYFIPMIICPGVLPLIFTITWDRQTTLAVVAAPISGFIFGISIWLSTAYHYYGEVTITSTGGQLPALFGSLTSLFLPGVVSIVISLFSSQKFDWSQLQQADLIIADDTSIEEIVKNDGEVSSDINEKTSPVHTTVNDTGSKQEKPHQLSERELDFWIKISTGAAIFVLLITWVLWPLPLYRDWKFTRAYFKGYVTVSLIWLYSALIVIGIMPLYGGRHSIARIFKGIYRDFIKRS